MPASSAASVTSPSGTKHPADPFHAEREVSLLAPRRRTQSRRQLVR